jgi:predicted glycoside hydrolase/deacetylase ChbG (UPF0249 family)
LRRILIVNADDFGLSRGVNHGIVRAYEHGIVTRASLMVLRAGAREAGDYARTHPGLSIGLHVDFGDWECHGGEWVKVIEGAPLDDARVVAHEVNRQVERFIELIGRDPTHLDSHQHVHRNEPLRSIVADLAAGLGIAARHITPDVRYCGDFYGLDEQGAPMPESITTTALLKILASLPPGTTELACHPGLDEDLASAYCHERAQEVAALCDPAVRAAIAAHGIELRGG